MRRRETDRERDELLCVVILSPQYMAPTCSQEGLCLQTETLIKSYQMWMQRSESLLCSSRSETAQAAKTAPL